MKVYLIINTIQLNYHFCKIAPLHYTSYFICFIKKLFSHSLPFMRYSEKRNLRIHLQNKIVKVSMLFSECKTKFVYFFFFFFNCAIALVNDVFLKEIKIAFKFKKINSCSLGI